MEPTAQQQRHLQPWHRLAPWPVLEDETLRSMMSYLDEPDAQAELTACEQHSEYPAGVRERLHALGFSRLLAESASARANESKVTTVHLCALNQLTAAINTSLSVTVGVNAFAFLPLYIAADEAQLQWAFDRISAGAYGAMMLSERENGSNLLANRTRAEPGVIEPNGTFRPVARDAEDASRQPTHYQLNGRKDLINGGSRHELLLVLARTGRRRSEVRPLSALSDFTFFVVERDATVTSPQRWQTLPVPAADIASAAFDGTLVPVERRLGREGSGFTLAQKTLAISRGGVAAFSAGVATRASTLATRYAQQRCIYGEPILALGAITDHLLRAQALELLVSAMSVKAAAALNAFGYAAAHYGAVAKYACCVLTEGVVTEGRLIHGSRALLTENPYHHLLSESLLLSTFDGTTHLVLDQIQLRLEHVAVAEPRDGVDALGAMAEIYQTRPQSLPEVTRRKTQPLVVFPAHYLRQLDAVDGDLPLQPLVDIAEALPAFVRHCRAGDLWKHDQGLRFEAAKQLAYLDTLVALVELADPGRRRRLGMPALPAADRLQPLVAFAYGWLGGQIAAALRAMMAGAGSSEAEALHGADQAFGRLYAHGRHAIRADPSLLTSR